jgi:hypothetical protein
MQEALRNWTSLGEAIKTMSEMEAQILLAAEVNGKQRKRFVIRLHQKFTALRATRERTELFEKCGIEVKDES